MIDFTTDETYTKRDLNSLHELAKIFLSNPTKPFPELVRAFTNINNLVYYCRNNDLLSKEYFYAKRPDGPMPCTVEDDGKAVSFTTVPRVNPGGNYFNWGSRLEDD